MSDDKKNLSPTTILRQWCNGIRIENIAQRRAATNYKKLKFMFGIPVTIFTAIIGTSIFGALAASENTWILIIAGIISIITAILSALYTFLKFDERSEKHRLAGVEYGNLRREIDIILAGQLTNEELIKKLDEIKTKWDNLNEYRPEVPQKIYDIAKKQAKSKKAD